MSQARLRSELVLIDAPMDLTPSTLTPDKAMRSRHCAFALREEDDMRKAELI